MNITDIKIRKIFSDQGRLIAVSSVVIDNEVAIHDIKILDYGSNGLRIAMPSRKDAKGGFHDIAHPVSLNARKQLEAAVINAYLAQSSKSELLEV